MIFRASHIKPDQKEKMMRRHRYPYMKLLSTKTLDTLNFLSQVSRTFLEFSVLIQELGLAMQCQSQRKFPSYITSHALAIMS